MPRFTFCIAAWIAAAGVFYPIFADGSLTVKTDPDGIEVWLDDNYVGDSPITDKKLKPGKYNLKLVDPVQHTSTVEEIFVQDNEESIIEKTLKSKFGKLKITSEPEGAKVYISTELGKTPLSNDFMNPGKYRVEIRHPNTKYNSENLDIVIPQGEVVNLSKTLKKNESFDKLDVIRLGLGVTTLGGFIWGIVDQANKTKYLEQSNQLHFANESQTQVDDLKKKSDSAGIRRTIGIVLGSVSLVGLEIVAFF